MSIRVVTDSSCDLPEQVVKELNISVLPLYIHTGSHEYLDGIDLSREQFYRDLPNYPEHPTTAVPSPQKFKAIYDSLAEEGAQDVISIHISHSLSGVVDVAHVAARETTSTRVAVLDSHQLSLGTGFLAETAARMASAGAALHDIMAALQDQIKRTHTIASLNTLEFLKRSPHNVTSRAISCLRGRKPSGVSAKYTQAAITKPVPQKISTMLAFLIARLTSHNTVMIPRMTASAIPYMVINVMSAPC